MVPPHSKHAYSRKVQYALLEQLVCLKASIDFCSLVDSPRPTADRSEDSLSLISSRFGPERVGDPSMLMRTTAIDESPVVTFIFRYRPFGEHLLHPFVMEASHIDS